MGNEEKKVLLNEDDLSNVTGGVGLERNKISHDQVNESLSKLGFGDNPLGILDSTARRASEELKPLSSEE